MGLYDTIYFRCPKCGKKLTAQSKSGDCDLGYYPNTAVPLEVAYDANRHAPIECGCGAVWAFDTSKLHSRQNIELDIIEYKEG